MPLSVLRAFVVNLLIYLDNNSTTPLAPLVWDVMTRVSHTAWANPGSRHQLGRKARQVYEDARDSIAGCLNAHPKSLTFTSGGTEAINLALFGLAHARPEKRHFAITEGDHPAASRPSDILVRQGWIRHLIPLDYNGLIVEDSLTQLPWNDLSFVTTLWANNETGVIQNLTSLSNLCQQHNVPLHLDAVQAVGKLPVDFTTLGVHALSFAAHKFHGPRGIGGLLLKEGTPFSPTLFGGFQEQGIRPGTELVTLAAGMATALQLATDNLDTNTTHIRTLRDRFEDELKASHPNSIIHGEQSPRLPNTSNIAFPDNDGEALLVTLDLLGLACSQGSACASGSSEPSPVLLAMHISEHLANNSLRFSLSRMTTNHDITHALKTLFHALGGQ